MKSLTDNLNLSLLELLSVLLPGAVSVVLLDKIAYVHDAVKYLLPESGDDWQQGIGYFAASFFNRNRLLVGANFAVSAIPSHLFEPLAESPACGV